MGHTTLMTPVVRGTWPITSRVLASLSSRWVSTRGQKTRSPSSRRSRSSSPAFASEPSPDRVLATVMFTDIVGSTDRLSRLGDRGWADLLAQHDAVVRSEIARHRGREIDRAGDGFFATFDGPARAVRCAMAVSGGVRGLGIEVRAGAHTGEVELADDGLRGMAVHIGARIMGLAAGNEVLVSATVRTWSLALA